MSTATQHRARRAAPTPVRPPELAKAALPNLVPLLIACGALGVLALWWRDTSVIRGADEWLTGASRIAGLLAGYGAPVLLLLMARIPVLERHVGADRLARWHAIGGRYVVGLVTVHLVTVIWGYALTAHKDVVSETGQLVFHYPEMIKATLGTLLMLGTGVVSARAARRRLSYEAWYYLHLATYLAIALTFAHQLANGADLIEGPGLLAWWALYLGSFAILGWFRLALPFLRDRRHRLRVAEVRPEADGVVSVFLTGRRLDALRCEPGQFFRLQFMVPGLRWAANPYSLSAPPHPKFLRFTVKDLGEHSAAVARLRPGVRVRAEGPYGAFTARRRVAPGRRVLLIAAGVGITPIRTLFETLPARQGQLTLLYRARRPEDVLFRDELQRVAARRQARLELLLGDRRTVGNPLTAASLSRLVPGLKGHEVFLCGPPEMMAATVRELRAAGVPQHLIHHESFEF